uniref:uncharacterized protein LOC122599624 n=1 Tax=Erigeron canadensis TaxID=72917 RepID=UPI001CB89AC3|nr:uncharacterized protein LOC122599624 [Erigeron canadensis]
MMKLNTHGVHGDHHALDDGSQMFGGLLMKDSKIFGGTKFMKIIQEEECKSSSSSSIGNNSDDDEKHEDDDAQSPYKYVHTNDNNKKMSNGSFDDAVQALEEALPIRRGISTFYNGKSKSFTCLADVSPSSTPSIQDIAKPENAYTRKRRNLLASTLLSSKSKNHGFELSNIYTGRISKKLKTTTLCFAAESDEPNLNKHATQPRLYKPLLLKKQNLSSLRSFSMVNLHACNSRLGLKSTEIENC